MTRSVTPTSPVFLPRPVKQPFAIAWDAGNGAAGAVLGALVSGLPGRHILLNGAVDGTFPAHHPDPTVPENLTQLIETVRAERCDLGIAFDGDGDRIGVVDGTGAILWGDQLVALLAREVLRERPGATVIGDVKASRVLFDEIARLGGTPLMWRTGHAPIKAKMAECGAPLAGEMSGHIFFADRYYGFDDALYAALRLLTLIAGEGRSLTALRAELPQPVSTPEVRFPCPDERKFRIADEIGNRLAAAGATFTAIDGVRAESEDWLVAAARIEHAAHAGGALRGGKRRGAGAHEKRSRGSTASERGRAARILVHVSHNAAVAPVGQRLH